MVISWRTFYAKHLNYYEQKYLTDLVEGIENVVPSPNL